MGRVISIASQKGGTGKTSTCINLGVALTLLRKSVLMLDNDPQGHLTIGLGFDKKQKFTLKTVLENVIEELEFDPSDIILHHDEKVDIIPANKSLGFMRIYLTTVADGESVLKEFLDKVKAQYDYILIDCAPTLDLLSMNALVASDSVIIPVELEQYAADGLEEILRTVKVIQSKYNPNLTIEGILYNKDNPRLRNTKRFKAAIEKAYGDQIHIFKNTIRDTIRISEASNCGSSIYEYLPMSDAGDRYLRVALEVDDHE